jgi:hypothetical protein
MDSIIQQIEEVQQQIQDNIRKEGELKALTSSILKDIEDVKEGREGIRIEQKILQRNILYTYIKENKTNLQSQLSELQQQLDGMLQKEKDICESILNDKEVSI